MTTHESKTPGFANVDMDSNRQNLLSYLDLVRLLPSALCIEDEIARLTSEMKPNSIVDIGCGTGDLLHLLVTRKCPTALGIGIEKSAFLTSAARERHGECKRLRFFIHDFSFDRLDEEECEQFDRFGQADVLILNRVTQHLIDPVRLIENAKRILRTGARVILSDVDWTRLEILNVDQHTSNQVIAANARSRVYATAGSMLCDMLIAAGLKDAKTTLETWHEFRDFSMADEILSLSRTGQSLMRRGELTGDQVAVWLNELQSIGSKGGTVARLFQSIAVGIV